MQILDCASVHSIPPAWLHRGSRKGIRWGMSDAQDVEGTCWTLMIPWYQKRHAPSWFSHEPSPSSHAGSFPSSTCASVWPYKKDTKGREGRAKRVAARIVNDFLGRLSRTIQYILFKCRRKWDAECNTTIYYFASIILT